MLLAHRLDLGAHRFVGEGAKRQAERRMVLFNRIDDRLGGANRIAGCCRSTPWIARRRAPAVSV